MPSAIHHEAGASGVAQRGGAGLHGGGHVVGGADAAQRQRGGGLGVEVGAAAGHEAGVHHARRHRQHAHRGREGARQRVAHHVDAGLGRGVGQVAAGAGERGDRRDVDDEPVARGLQQRHEGAHGRHDAAEIDLQHLVDQRVGQRFQVRSRHRLRAAGAVDEDVHHAVARLHRGGGGLQRGAVQHLGGHGAVLLPVGDHRQRRGQCLGLGRGAAAVQQHAVRTQSGQAVCGGHADGAGAAGDDGHAAGQGIGRSEISHEAGLREWAGAGTRSRPAAA